MNILFLIVTVVAVIFLMGIRIVRPTHRALIERFGKYDRFASPGFSWGLEIVRTELKEIDPPKDVQETMNSVKWQVSCL